jgi:hypothetical protein
MKSWIVRTGFVVLLLVLISWFAIIWHANQIARHNFGPEPCWFVHAVPDRSPPRLMPGPRGFHLPNPLRQINRRFIGLGVKDPEVLAPHFAVAALDHRGRPTLWGWSYWTLDFWSLSAADDASAFYDSYTDREAILAACPRLPHASPAYTGQRGLR